MQARRVIALPVAALSVALAAAGCGGSGSPQVASLGGGTTTGAPAGSAPPASSGDSGGGPGLTLKTQNGLKFSQCMRAHGVANFPDPNSQGEIHIGPGAG